MVVAAHPTSELSVGSELELVKTALLYGDRVTVLSPVVTMLSGVEGLKTLPLDGLLELVGRVAPDIVEPGQDAEELQRGLDQLRAVLRSGGRGSTERVLREGLARQLDPFRHQIADVVQTMRTSAGVDQLDQARAMGLIQFEQLDVGDTVELVASCVIAARRAETGRPNDDDHSDRMVQTFVDRLSRHLSSGRDYLIFDEQIASLTDSAIREGVFVPASGPAGRSAQAMTASGFLTRLPTFPDATVDEVLDIRSELAPSLSHFRAAMVAIAKHFTSEAWETGFEDEVHDAWVEMACPAVEAIESSVRSSGSLLAIASGIAGGANLSFPGLALVGAGMVGHANGVAALGGALSGRTNTSGGQSPPRRETRNPDATLLLPLRGAEIARPGVTPVIL